MSKNTLLFARAIQCSRDRTFGQLFNQSFLVNGRAVQVVARLGIGGGELGGVGDGRGVWFLAIQKLLGLLGFDRSRADISERDTSLIDDSLVVERKLDRDGGGSKVADLAFNL